VVGEFVVLVVVVLKVLVDVLERVKLRLLVLPSLFWFTMGMELFCWLMVQLVKMVFDTSRGMMKMMRNEKYQAIMTATVTRMGCLIQFEYLHSSPAANINAMQISKTKTVYAIVKLLL